MKHRIYRRFFFLTILVSAFILTACQKSTTPPPIANPHPLTPHQRSLVSQIRHAGGRVIKQGEVLQVVLPTDTFFQKNTTRIKRKKRYAVNRVASLVKSYTAPYRHPRIRVTGYTDTVFPRMTRKKLSQEYAKEIAAYLWRRGIPQRGVHVRGKGAARPIASERTPRGAAYNRRVVVRVN